jgi:hypothetical protein
VGERGDRRRSSLKELFIYVEGGGESRSNNRSCRLGFTDLFSEHTRRARSANIALHFRACGSRNDAFEDFCTAIRTSDPTHRINLLLVDQEDELPEKQPGERHHRWRHVRERDQWDRPAIAIDGYLSFMVMCVEAWIVADQTALKEHYGNCITMKPLPGSNIESVPRDQLYDRLRQATAGCKVGYVKRHAFELTGKLRMATISQLSSVQQFCNLLDYVIAHWSVP